MSTCHDCGAECTEQYGKATGSMIKIICDKCWAMLTKNAVDVPQYHYIPKEKHDRLIKAIVGGLSSFTQPIPEMVGFDLDYVARYIVRKAGISEETQLVHVERDVPADTAPGTTDRQDGSTANQGNTAEGV